MQILETIRKGVYDQQMMDLKLRDNLTLGMGHRTCFGFITIGVWSFRFLDRRLQLAPEIGLFPIKRSFCIWKGPPS